MRRSKTKYVLLILSLSACVHNKANVPSMATQTESKVMHKFNREHFMIQPLPGSMNTTPVFHSNRPELIKSAGEIIHTKDLQPLSGRFGCFVHHVIETPSFSPDQFRLGLLARSASKANVSLKQTHTAQARTRPEAPFITLDSVQAQTGNLWSGPGSAMALQRLNQTSVDKHWDLGSEEQLLMDIPITTNPLFFIQQRNALSGLFHFESNGSVHLRWVVTKGKGTLNDYQEAALKPAGPAELPATQYNPEQPSKGGVFRFGRVAGIVEGDRWQGKKTLSAEEWDHLLAKKTLAWPVATTYLKQWQTQQNQSAKIIKKTPESAVQSHGNYGVTYTIKYVLKNPTQKPLTTRWRWGQPTQVTKDKISYLEQTQTVFRGSLRIQVKEVNSETQTNTVHLSIKQGVLHKPFFEDILSPNSTKEVTLSWVYPPDAIPPQLLSLELGNL